MTTHVTHLPKRIGIGDLIVLAVLVFLCIQLWPSVTNSPWLRQHAPHGVIVAISSETASAIRPAAHAVSKQWKMPSPDSTNIHDVQLPAVVNPSNQVQCLTLNGC